jgi:hypothetical protein
MDKSIDPSDPTIINGALDLDRLRLPQDFAATESVKKLLTTVPIRKPDRQSFCRVHPNWAFPAAILEVKEDRDSYLVMPELLPSLQGEAVAKTLFAAITRQGVVFLWPVRLPDPSGRHDAWSRSALSAAAEAKQRWIRVAANMSLGAYETYIAQVAVPEPEWPDLEFDEVLKIAFQDRIVESLDHPVVRRLRGEL